uniref:DUF4371 domain-containing protein n=1 Tax=Oryzias latipes TaxID=8090 RepID=A0A3P9II95_ORYLA
MTCYFLFAMRGGWSHTFQFTNTVNGLCLICNDKIASMKRSNIKQHCDTRHAAFALKFPAGDSRKKACQDLLSRPFTDGEFAKSFMLDVTNELCANFSDKDKIIKQIKDMPLSARTVHDRTIMMSNQIEETQVKDINASTDVSNLSQFSVIARYVAGDTLLEESLAVLPLKGTTRGEDLFKSFNEFAKEKNLPMDKLVSVCTDGVPCMVGKNGGFVALLREHEKRRILSFHCILHQEALCAQMCGEQLGEGMSLVVRVVNFIVARALNDRQFKALLDEVGNSYPGLLLHSNVRWLSRGKVYSRFAACLSEIRTFLERKNVKHPELANTEWLLKFYYLVDMTGHLNHLNVKMQCVVNTILSLQEAVFAFENKLELFITNIETAASRILRAHSDFELQAADLKASDLWVNKLERQQAELASQHKWEEMKKLQPHVSVAVLTMFGSTYACDNVRSRLTDGSLNACMKLNLSSYQPDYKSISKTMQHQKSNKPLNCTFLKYRVNHQIF